jgi:antitoxin PrlF
MNDVQAPRFEATLTDKYQNTVPAAVRKALHLGKRDKIAYIIRDGQVVLEKAEPQDDRVDPAVQAFLGFLEREMINDPKRLRPFGGEKARQAAELVEGMDVDLDAPLDE